MKMMKTTRWIRGWGYGVLLALLAVGALPGASVAEGAVFPDPSIPQSNSSGINRSHGLKNAIYFWIRSDTGSPLSQSRINSIRESEQQTRQFFAESSGGAFDIYYDHIVDVPLPLDANGRHSASSPANSSVTMFSMAVACS